ncbi:hypothetical protein CIL05_02870 [Virgibacillus profundi]|uniref:Peptidase C45 hydrolase domain-containing protein n=1 Tax=Virgibacillus profundi TaxID=2024555 RepID=A0A2A2IKF8_9BACI|nr:C45 family peptidase [Virgibacillus profundi]PAV31615.1 hypothetical protein CIL05_02870 [Virgibacillus profundi]PXY55801.1 peptidase C45 [Virgibacillus profundi]
MKPITVTVEQYRNTAYQTGFLQGKQLSNSLLSKLSILENKHFTMNDANKLFEHFAPHLLDEIQGLADALEISVTKAASLFSGYGIPGFEGMGCSSVVNQRYAVRNYDFSPEIYDHRLVFIQSEGSFSSVGHSLHVIGRHEGVNEKGLYAAFHFVEKERPKLGLTASTVIRIILDTCESTEDAVDLLKQLPHSWGYNFSIGDRDGNTAIVEIMSDEIRVRKSEGILLCTNHYQHHDLIDKNKNDYTNSYRRIEDLEEKGVNRLTGKEAFDWFKTPDSAMFYKDYKNLFGTLHTFAYLFDKEIILTALPYGETLEIDWKAWVDGNNIRTTRINGKIIQAH